MSKKLDPRVERLLLLILEARRARLAGEDLEGQAPPRIRRIEMTTAPAPERAVIR